MRAIFFSLLLANAGYFIYRSYVYVEPEIIPVVPASSSGGSIYLLNENSGSSLREKEMDLVMNNPVQTAVDGARSCMAIGPFDTLFKGQAVVDRLNALGMLVELKALDIATGESDYRLMIPPTASLQAAFRKLRELKSQEIDSYVISQGKDALGISLGVFSTQDAAKALQKELQAVGYEASVRAMSRFSREFWIYSQEGQNLEIAGPVWASLVEDNPEIQKKARQCLET